MLFYALLSDDLQLIKKDRGGNVTAYVNIFRHKSRKSFLSVDFHSDLLNMDMNARKQCEQRFCHISVVKPLREFQIVSVYGAASFKTKNA